MIDRRTVLTGFVGATAAALAGAPARAVRIDRDSPTRRLFKVETEIDLSAQPGEAHLWVPLFAQRTQYQRLIGLEWQGKARIAMAGNARQSARVLTARWNEQENRKLTVIQTLATWDREPAGAGARLSAAERAFWTAPMPGQPIDGIVAATARTIVGTRTDPRDKLRAIYDWVVTNTWRDPATVGCGTGDIATMLSSGKLGGKCADLNGLMISLARASGIPARDVYGIRLAPSRLSPSLGKNTTVSGAQHCRAEAWIDGLGWMAIDPADVRKAILEDKLDPAGEQVRALSQHLFGHWEDNWAAFNMGTGIALPGAGDQQPYRFVMYPTAVCANSKISCTDAAKFAYRITATELKG